MNQLNPIDSIINECDKAVRMIWGVTPSTDRLSPTDDLKEGDLSESEKQQSMRLMRVNHAGEVSAQGLYQGQALTAKLPEVRAAMDQAAQEENDHLAWCEQRIHELDGKTSLLNPFWYVGSLALGAVAGKVGDKWSLGFVAETETQVVKHLESHLEQLSEKDIKSRAIVEKMRDDEAHHRQTAIDAGGVELPKFIKTTMAQVSKLMIAGSYRL